MKIINYMALALFCAFLIYASTDLPGRGEENCWLNKDTSPVGTPNAASYYIRHAYQDTHTPNMVTAILADYRGYDTLGEETVILTAGLVCYLLLRKGRKKKNEER